MKQMLSDVAQTQQRTDTEQEQLAVVKPAMIRNDNTAHTV